MKTTQLIAAFGVFVATQALSDHAKADGDCLGTISITNGTETHIEPMHHEIEIKFPEDQSQESTYNITININLETNARNQALPSNLSVLDNSITASDTHQRFRTQKPTTINPPDPLWDKLNNLGELQLFYKPTNEAQNTFYIDKYKEMWDTGTFYNTPDNSLPADRTRNTEQITTPSQR